MVASTVDTETVLHIKHVPSQLMEKFQVPSYHCTLLTTTLTRFREPMLLICDDRQKMENSKQYVDPLVHVACNPLPFPCHPSHLFIVKPPAQEIKA